LLGSRPPRTQTRVEAAQSLRERILVGSLPQQRAFLEDTTSRILGLVAGFGSGKTHALCNKVILLALANPCTAALVAEPTYPMVRDVFCRSFDDVLDGWGIEWTFRSSPQPEYELFLDGGPVTVLCRSLENWQRIRGQNLSFCLADEIDAMPVEVAQKASEMMLARMRSGSVNQLAVTTTPEGFRWAYRTFVEQAAEDRTLMRARTRDNPYLPADYVGSLERNYPPQLVKAYLEGEFVNLATGTVYDRFDREKHLEDVMDLPGEPLRVGIDFNVGNMNAVVAIRSGDGLIVIDEVVKEHDTDSLGKELLRRYPRRRIFVYPDASGSARSTNATRTDIQILESYGMSNQSPKANPPVRDRIASVQALLENGRGEVRLKISPNCKKLIECLELQSYTDKGEPDKESGYDHLNDALGYLIWRERNPLHAQAGRPAGIRIY